MKLQSVYARFFRSLNFDYLESFRNSYSPKPWDATPDGGNTPFVQIDLERDITTIVGGNESGKSQVLAAIEFALTTKEIQRSDFCRYSPFFSVDADLTRPEFGALFGELSADDRVALGELLDQSDLSKVDQIGLFRMNQTPKNRIYFRRAGVWDPEPATVKKPQGIRNLGMPRPFRIDADIPLPDSVPIDYLVTGKAESVINRQLLRSLCGAGVDHPSWFEGATAVSENAENIASALYVRNQVDDRDIEKFSLASSLLIQIAGLDPEIFEELQTAVTSRNGYANSIVDTINGELAKSLNFPNWWSQDSKFELFVALHEFDLIFMIRDRTGRSYGFDERSEGLKYFLSYFVQYLAHSEPDDGGQEILLMDEPDRYLSSSGQQDLLKVFGEFASPTTPGTNPVQVVYVTHSPFLIDKNHSERIRVLEKGEYDEGTRVVANVAQNHYEPLRSAFGAFVGETTFIGSCNLMVEGASDQILIAGMSSWLGRRKESVLNRLDLNEITIVPAGGAPHIPYLAYLARGRDVEQPAVIVLLDADTAGDEARAALKRGGARRKELVPKDFVLQLSDDDLRGLQTDNPHGVVAIEDLVPFEIALSAAEIYCREFAPDVDVSSMKLEKKMVLTAASGKVSPTNPPKDILDLLQQQIGVVAGRSDFSIDKIGFARSVMEALSVAGDSPATDQMADNFRRLLGELGRRQREAMKVQTGQKISSRINRIRSRFLQTHVNAARGEDIILLEEEISNQLGESFEAEEVRMAMARWHLDYSLDEPTAQIEKYESFVEDLRTLAYTGTLSSETEPGQTSNDKAP